MNLIWWILWMVMLFWIFATPFDIPGQRNRPAGPLDILQRRFAAGQITNEEYQNMKKVIENDMSKMS